MSSEPHWPVFPPSPSFLLSPHRCRTCFVVRSLPLSAPTTSSLYPSQMFPLRNLSNVSYCLSSCSSSVPTTHLILRPVDQRGSLNWPGEELSMAPGNRLSQGEVAGSNYKWPGFYRQPNFGGKKKKKKDRLISYCSLKSFYLIPVKFLIFFFLRFFFFF